MAESSQESPLQTNEITAAPFASVEAALLEKEVTARQFSERLQALINLSHDLSREKTLDSLCQNAIGRGRKELGFDRLGLWFSVGENRIMGSWGTDEYGELRDERGSQATIGPDSMMGRVLAGQKRIIVEEDNPLYNNDI